MDQIPKKISSKTVFSDYMLDLNIDRVIFPSGKITEDYHVINFKNESVVVILQNENMEICFIRSPRYTTGQIEWELPAGGIEKDEDITKAAEREILEETGYTVNKLNHIYTFNPANSISDQKAHVLTGQVLSNSTAGKVNNDEVISVQWLTEEQIKNLIMSNKIMDGFSVLALLLFFYRNII